MPDIPGALSELAAARARIQAAIDLLSPAPPPPPPFTPWLPVQVIEAGATGYSETGAGWAQWVAGDSRYANTSGAGSKAASYAFSGLTAGAPLKLGMSWQNPTSNFGSANTFQVFDSGGTAVLASGTYDQSGTPNDARYSARGWKEFGASVTPTGTTLTLKISSAAGGYIVAGGAYVVPAAAVIPANYAITAAGVVSAGLFTDFADGANLYRRDTGFGTGGLPVTCRVRGRYLFVSYFVGTAAQFAVLIDGAAASPGPVTTNSRKSVRVDMGADDWHDVEIRGYYYDRPYFVQVDGATRDLTFHSYVGNATAHLPVRGSAGVANDGYAPNYNYNGNQAYLSNTTNVSPHCLRFRGAITSLSACVHQAVTKVRYAIDGVLQAPATTPDGGAYWRWQQLATGLDGTAEHTYEVWTHSPYPGFACHVAGTGTGLSTASLAQRKAVVFWGDSTSAAYGLPTSNDGWAWKAAQARGAGAIVEAVSGQTVVGFGNPSLANVTRHAAKAETVVILFGVNDNPADVPTFKAAYKSMVAGILAGMSGTCRVFCLGILPQAGDLTHATRNTAIGEAVAEIGNARATFHGTNGLTDPTAGVHTTDGTHLNAAGGELVAAFVAGLN